MYIVGVYVSGGGATKEVNMTITFGNGNGILVYTNIDRINDTTGEYVIFRNDNKLVQTVVNGVIVSSSRAIFVDREIFNKYVVTVRKDEDEDE